METKKTPKADLNRLKGIFFNVGLSLSIGTVLFAFEYKSYDVNRLIDHRALLDDAEELLDIPITIQQPPPPPPKEQPTIQEVPNDEEIEIKFDVLIDLDIEVVTPDDVYIPDLPIETADEIFDVVETPPTPSGGMEQWNAFLRKNLKYPSQAKRMGIEGTVYISFVVNTDGSLQDIAVVRSIGGGCDEEALRVISAAPNWNPGKQRGRAVRVKMSMPIRFKLN